MFVLISGMWRVTVDGVSLFVNAAVCLPPAQHHSRSTTSLQCVVSNCKAHCATIQPTTASGHACH
eukprot:12203-Heterococcus_DN1.PRE.3